MFFDFFFYTKSTTMYYKEHRCKVLQAYKTYHIIISIIQYINIFPHVGAHGTSEKYSITLSQSDCDKLLNHESYFNYFF